MMVIARLVVVAYGAAALMPSARGVVGVRKSIGTGFERRGSVKSGGLFFCGANNRKRTRVVVFEAGDEEAHGAEADGPVGGGKKTAKELAAAFAELAAPYFRETSEAKWGLARVVGLTLLQSGVSVAISYTSRDFYNALSARDVAEFQTILLKFGAVLLAAVPATVLYRFERETLSLRWRRWMTDDVLSKYTRGRTFYELEAAGDIDNPDQRIAEDVYSFTDVSLGFGIAALTSVVDLISFSSILYSIYAPLFGAIAVYATLGTWLTAYVGRDLPELNFGALKKEADFRYALVRLRENAEAIAFYDGQDRERVLASNRLDKAVDAQQAVLGAQRRVEFVTVSYRFLIQVLPVAIVAPLYFQKKIELGVVTQSSSAFNHVLSDVSQIVNQFESIAAFGAGLDRLKAFTDGIDPDRRGQAGATQTLVSASDDDVDDKTDKNKKKRPVVVLEARDVEVKTPRGRPLVSDLDLSLGPGDRLLLVGASGAGKSSVLRTLAGLWKPSRGTVAVADDAFFLPQKPYCALGSLREQLLYPNRRKGDDSSETRVADAVLIDLLRDVGLGRLAPRLDLVADWTNTLSLGEQQRLAFARLILAAPSLAVCDEATSALDVDAERHLYTLLQAKLGPDLALVSVGHRPSLLQHHTLRLRLPTPDDLDNPILLPPILEPVSPQDRDAASRLAAV